MVPGIVVKDEKVSDSTQRWKVEALLAVKVFWRDLIAGIVPLRTSFGPCSGEEGDRLFGNHASLKKLLKLASPAYLSLNKEQVKEAKEEAIRIIKLRCSGQRPKEDDIEWPIDRMKLFSAALICRIREDLREKASKETLYSLMVLERCAFRCLHHIQYRVHESASHINLSKASLELITERGKIIVNGLPQVGTNFQALEWLTQKLRPWSPELETELQRAMESKRGLVDLRTFVNLRIWTDALTNRNETNQRFLTLMAILQLYSPRLPRPSFRNIEDVSRCFDLDDASLVKKRDVWLAIDRALEVLPLLFQFPDDAHPPGPSTLGHVASIPEAASINERCSGVSSVQRVSGAQKRKATDPNSESEAQIRCLTTERGLSRDGDEDEADSSRNSDAVDTAYSFKVFSPSVFDDA